MKEDRPTFEETSLTQKEIEPKTETEIILDSELETLFAERKIDSFFEQSINYAISDPKNFCQFYKKFLAEKFSDDKFLQIYDNDSRFHVLTDFNSRFTHKRENADFDKQKEQLLQEAKETKEFNELMIQRKRNAQEKSQKIFDELNIQEHGNIFSEKETNELIEQLRLNIEDSRILKLLTHYYLYAQGEFHMTSSMKEHIAWTQDKKYLDRKNERLADIWENPEEFKLVIDMLSEKLRTIIEKSNNPDAVALTNKENLTALPNYTLVKGDFLHGTTIDSLDKINKRGFLCRKILYPEYAKNSMSQIIGGSVSFGKQTGSEIIEKRRMKNEYANILIQRYCRNSFLEKYRGNIASEYGAYDVSVRHYLRRGEQISKKSREEELKERKERIIDIKAAGDDAITYIMREQKDSYELSAGTATSHSDEYGVGIGVPSTEIKGVIVDATSETAVKKVLSELCKYPFYVPAYDSETGTLINESMKKLYE